MCRRYIEGHPHELIKLCISGRALLVGCIIAIATASLCRLGVVGYRYHGDSASVFPLAWLKGVTPGAKGGDCNDGAACMSALFTRHNSSHALSMRIGRHRKEGASGTRKVRQIAGDNRYADAYILIVNAAAARHA